MSMVPWTSAGRYGALGYCRERWPGLATRVQLGFSWGPFCSSNSVEQNQLSQVHTEVRSSAEAKEFCGSAEHPGRNRKQKTENVEPVFGGKFGIQSVDRGVNFIVLKHKLFIWFNLTPHRLQNIGVATKEADSALWWTYKSTPYQYHAQNNFEQILRNVGSGVKIQFKLIKVDSFTLRLYFRIFTYHHNKK